MGPLSKFMIAFFISSVLYFYFIFNGDDDIVDRIKNRKPTPNEGLRRTLYVSRAFSSVFGGGLLGIALARYYLFPYKIVDWKKFTVNEKDAFAILFILIAFVILRFLQNIIRYFQGRKSRPLLDIKTMRDNIQNWSN